MQKESGIAVAGTSGSFCILRHIRAEIIQCTDVRSQFSRTHFTGRKLKLVDKRILRVVPGDK